MEWFDGGSVGMNVWPWPALVQGVNRHRGFTDLVAGIAISEGTDTI